MISVRDMFDRIRSAADLFGSACRVAGALEARQDPDARDLRRMGIAPDAFSKMKRR